MDNLEMKELGADDILNSNDLKYEKVEVPEWGGFVYVKMMSAKERDAWEYANYVNKENAIRNVRGSLLQKTICNVEGKLIFKEEHAEQLGEKGSSAVERVFSVAQKLNKLRASDLEDMTKN